MYIRQTKTSKSPTGETYSTYRLVASTRIGGKVRQQTLLNLGKNFDLAKELWPQLCARIEQILAGQLSLIPEDTAIEKLARRYAARLVMDGSKEASSEGREAVADYQEVDVASLELVQPRSIGVEHAGLAALTELQLPRILADIGLNGVQQAAADQAVEVRTASEKTVRIQRVLSEDGAKLHLYCHSDERQDKENAITKRFMETFERGPAKIAAALQSPRGEKRRDTIQQRLGRLQEKSHGIAQHYRIAITPDETGDKEASLTWEKLPVVGTILTHPGGYCLRTNELDWDENILWRTYTMLTDLEAVFRSLKSELALRPIYHHREDRAEGHLFITVLAYQAVQVLRRRLKGHGFQASWSTLNRIFAGQCRITATFSQKDGRTLHVRKTSVAEPRVKQLYDALGISVSPVGVRKMVR